MTNLLKKAAESISAVRHEHMAESVVYVRPGSPEKTVTIAATLGTNEWEELDSEGHLNTNQSRDFIVRASDLDFGDGVFVPIKGDYIKQTINGVVYRFTLMKDQGEQIWRWTTPHQIDIRIHTKYTGEVS